MTPANRRIDHAPQSPAGRAAFSPQWARITDRSLPRRGASVASLEDSHDNPQPFDMGHYADLLALSVLRAPRGDQAAEAAWRREVAELVRKSRSLSDQLLAELGDLIEAGPDRVPGRPERPVPATIMSPYVNHWIGRGEALRLIVQDRGQPETEANLKAAERAFTKEQKRGNWFRPPSWSDPRKPKARKKPPRLFGL